MPELTDPKIETSRRFQSDRLTDLIGSPPNWIVNSGFGLILMITLMFILISWFIRYPDIVEVPVTVTVAGQPLKIYSQQSALIDTILVNDGSQVMKNQTLFYYKNPTSVNDLLLWKDWINKMLNHKEKNIFINPPPSALQLGELQDSYSKLYQDYDNWMSGLDNTGLIQKIISYESEIASTKLLINSLQQQINYFEKDFVIQQKNLSRQMSLLESGVISPLEFEKDESALLVFQRQKESISSGMFTYKIRIDQLESLILDITIEYENQLQKLFSIVKTQCFICLSDIQKWETNNIAKATADGIINIPSATRAKKYVTIGEEVMTLVSIDTGLRSFALAKITVNELGKIDIGNRSLIRLARWPYKQYGSLNTKIESISSLPVSTNNTSVSYEIWMPLETPLKTTSGYIIAPFPEEFGTVRVITQDKRILVRLFDNFKDKLNNELF